MVYFTLVTTAMVVFGGIELGAQRAVDMQHALLEINTQSQGYLLAFRRDVESARKVRLTQEVLSITRLDGIEVVYRGIERRELGPKGVERGRHVFRRLQKLSFTRDPKTQGIVCTAEFGSTLEARSVVRREFRRMAIPRRAP